MTGPDDALLADDLRAIAPRPAPELRARLDAQVAAGFPRPARRWAWPSMRLLVPALGTLGAALVAVVLVLSGGDAGRPEVAMQQPARESAADSSAGSAAPAAPAAPSTVAPAPAAGRSVERSSRLVLAAPDGRFVAVTDGVIRATQRHGGFVADSHVVRDDDGGTGTFVLRVPSSRLDAAIAELSRLASVRAIEGSTRDLTGEIDSASARLDDARTQRRAIVSALATAEGREADRLRSRLRSATARVERLERETRALRSRTTYATVDLTVVDGRRGTVAPPGDDGPWTPGDAWRDARRALEVAAGVLIVLASFLVPVGLVAWLATWLVRRRRDAVLDQT